MKLDYRLTVLVGLGFMTISAFWSLYDFVIPMIMLKAFEFGDTMAGVIMSFDNVLALFMLPLFVLYIRRNIKMLRGKQANERKDGDEWIFQVFFISSYSRYYLVFYRKASSKKILLSAFPLPITCF